MHGMYGTYGEEYVHEIPKPKEKNTIIANESKEDRRSRIAKRMTKTKITRKENKK